MSIYKKGLGALLVKLEDGFCIIKGREVYRVNEIGARIFDLCTIENTIEQIAEKLSKIYEVDQKQILEDVEVYICELEKMSCVKRVG